MNTDQIHDKYDEPSPQIPTLVKNVPVTNVVETKAGGMGKTIHPHGGDTPTAPAGELSEDNVRSQFIDVNAKPSAD